MAVYTDNLYYLSIDGTDVSAYVTQVTLDPSIDTIETTAGSGTDDRTRAPGLRDHSISFDIQHWDAAEWALTLIAVGTHTVIFGLEGSGSGNPKHTQSFIFESAPVPTTVEKEVVLYSVSGSGQAAPSVNMFAGGVWA